MMGRRKGEQGQLFYAFDAESVVPEDHQVRRIAVVLDLSWVRAKLAPYYSHTGRPSIDPELMIRMLILGYVFAIRSERALCREVQVNLAYRWFCGLGIEDKIPDHSAFTRARNERFREHDVFRDVFERIVAACIKADLVGGTGFAVDASLIAGMPTSAARRLATNGAATSIRRRQSVRCEIILPTLTIPRGALPQTSYRSSSRLPIQLHNGPAHCATLPSSLTPTTISLM